VIEMILAYELVGLTETHFYFFSLIGEGIGRKLLTCHKNFDNLDHIILYNHVHITTL